MTIASNGICVGRRAVLTGVGAVGLTGVLAACGSDDTSSTPAAGASATGSAGSTPGVLTAVADVPVGGGVVVGDVLVVQPESGTFKAYDVACPHQGVKVGTPQDGVIICPAHKSTFKAADGSLVSGPATRGLTTIAVTVQGSDIVRA
jgi:nitrite reductase/ring-hydroxylating ferredoxin subunit